jgi:hypothetical protein
MFLTMFFLKFFLSKKQRNIIDDLRENLEELRFLDKMNPDNLTALHTLTISESRLELFARIEDIIKKAMEAKVPNIIMKTVVKRYWASSRKHKETHRKTLEHIKKHRLK